MRLPLVPYPPGKTPGPRCVVCHDTINGDREVTIRGMHFHWRCATYKRRTERARR